MIQRTAESTLKEPALSASPLQAMPVTSAWIESCKVTRMPPTRTAFASKTNHTTKPAPAAHENAKSASSTASASARLAIPIQTDLRIHSGINGRKILSSLTPDGVRLCEVLDERPNEEEEHAI